MKKNNLILWALVVITLLALSYNLHLKGQQDKKFRNDPELKAKFDAACKASDAPLGFGLTQAIWKNCVERTNEKGEVELSCDVTCRRPQSTK